MSTNHASRRDFFSRIANSLHGAALLSLFSRDLYAAYDLTAKQPHHEPKAKSVIQFFMNGGPSQVDLFDPKPALSRNAGQKVRDVNTDVSDPRAAGGLLPSPFAFKKHGQCGMDVSDALPHMASVVDDVAFIRSMYGEHSNHEPALFLMQSGRIVPARPTMGAWVAYGLGTENRNLPAYVVLDDPKGLPINGISNWQSAYLPPVYQGTRFRTEGPPVLNLQPREELSTPLVEAQRKLLRRLDEMHRVERPRQPDLDGRIASYELAARMQLAASDALDINQESEATREAYGLNDPATQSYGKRCLMARRLVERGVRFVQLYIEGQIWDNHSNLESSLRYATTKTDKPVVALLRDLKARGLFDSTLLVWGGEFGRLPISQAEPGKEKEAGRDHGPSGFTVWLAGAGIKGGTVYGATDELGHKAVEDRVSVHDFHATILHLLGLNNRALTYDRHGLAERLTDQFPARVVKEVLA
ncbi:MAG: DUF1501 domain-containing protein [Acidobacteria bacterium]|nr:DUF1501 domain-containing protein [Acidobacteriota bacterium]